MRRTAYDRYHARWVALLAAAAEQEELAALRASITGN